MAPLPNRVSNRNTWLATVLAGLLPLIIGMAVSFFTIERSLHAKNEQVIKAGLEHFDDLFTQLQASARLAEHLLGLPCDTHVGSLPDLTLGFLRLTRQDCTQPEAEQRAAGQPTRHWLSINPQDPASPTRGVLLFNHGTPQRFVSVVVDNQWVTKWMKMISGDTYLSLRIANLILWDDGATLRGVSTDRLRYEAKAQSALWPYTLHSTLSSDDVLETIFNELLLMLARLSVLSVICAGLCHWALTRRPR